MQKIRMITDSPSDIPDEDLARYGIGMCHVPITIDGKGYYERRDFTLPEFYGMLENASEIPITSRIPVSECAALFHQAYEDGCTEAIMVTLNAGGSGIYDSARMGGRLFYHERPEARGQINIYLVDSGSYSIPYGYAVVQAARMAQEGQSVRSILDYLEDYYDRIEIYLACYTLEYAKRSGRISAAAAFMGEALGLRPIISLIDGRTEITAKVRGQRNLLNKLLEIYRRRQPNRNELLMVADGAVDANGNELCAIFRREVGREIPKYKLGAAILINSGPNVAGFATLGKRRGRPRPALLI